MRKYQRDLASEIRTHYQSKDALRYFYIALRLGRVGYYRPTDRESRIIRRRMTEGIVIIAKKAKEAVQVLSKAIIGAADSIRQFFDSIGKEPEVIKRIPTHFKIDPIYMIKDVNHGEGNISNSLHSGTEIGQMPMRQAPRSTEDVRADDQSVQ